MLTFINRSYFLIFRRKRRQTGKETNNLHCTLFRLCLRCFMVLNSRSLRNIRIYITLFKVVNFYIGKQLHIIFYRIRYRDIILQLTLQFHVNDRRCSIFYLIYVLFERDHLLFIDISLSILICGNIGLGVYARGQNVFYGATRLIQVKITYLVQ